MPATPPPTWLALVGDDPAPLLDWLRAWRQAAPAGAQHHGVLVAGHANPQALWPACANALGWDHRLPHTPWPPGFHRLHGSGGTLTLCLGDPAQLIPTLSCHAHGVWVDASLQTLPHLAKTLARLCAVGAQLSLPHPPPPHTDTHTGSSASSADATGLTAATPNKPDPETAAWVQAGFVAPTPETHTWVYQPRWPVPAPPRRANRHAMVIGAGLAGAALCASLTRRGWRVDLLDQHSGPAQGASALPVGLLSEHVTAHATVMSELSQTGLALTLRELQARVPVGQGWQPTFVSHLEPARDPAPHTPPHPEGGAAPANATLTLPAALIRPSALVQAWLAEANATGLLTTHWLCAVAQLRHTGGPDTPLPPSASPDEGHWQALDAQGQLLVQAPHAVVTAAFDSAALLSPHMAGMAAEPPLRAVKGQMTCAPLVGAPLAPHALREHGVFVPCYEDSQHPIASRLWTMGSTYERGQNNRTTTAEAQERNAQSLQAMWPSAHERLRQQQASGAVVNWAEVRCASLDRLPLVGAVPQTAELPASTQLAALPRVPGLWVLCALGSRGLTLSKLAAELLVARMLGEPWPMEKRHADALDPGRFALKAARSQGPKRTVGAPGTRPSKPRT